MPEFEEEINQKKEKAKLILDKKDGNLEAQRDTFDYMIQKFRKSGKQNYHFLTRAGNKFQGVVFKLIQRMFVEETFPSAFQNTTLHMIPKGSTARKDVISENRFIHLRSGSSS